MVSSAPTGSGTGSTCEGAGAGMVGAAGAPDHRPNQDPLGGGCGWTESLFSTGAGLSTSIGFVGSVGSISTGLGSVGFGSARLGSSGFAASSGLGSVDAGATGWALTGLPNHPPNQPGAGCVGVVSAAVTALAGGCSGGPASGRASSLSCVGPPCCGIGALSPASSTGDVPCITAGPSRPAAASPFSTLVGSDATSTLMASGSFLVLNRLRSTAVFDLTVPPKMVSRATWMEAADFRGREPYQLCFLFIWGVPGQSESWRQV